MIRDILCHNAARRNKSMPSDSVTAYDRCVGSNARTLSHRCRLVELMPRLRILAARTLHIGEYHGGSAEHIITELHAVINTYVVLDLTVTADRHTGSHKDVLPQITAFPNRRTGADVRKVPDFRSSPDARTIVDTSTQMDKIAFLLFHFRVKSFRNGFSFPLIRGKDLESYTDILYPDGEL